MNIHTLIDLLRSVGGDPDPSNPIENSEADTSSPTNSVKKPTEPKVPETPTSQVSDPPKPAEEPVKAPQGDPFPPLNSTNTISFDALETMTPEEINDNWKEVCQVIDHHINQQVS